MAKDPAFLFYPADASEDTQFMNRLERGCYFDLLKAQKKFQRFTIDLVKKVLGRDFEACWPAIESVLSQDSEGYFIGWVHDSIEKRKAFTESRRNNRSKANNDELYVYIAKDHSTGHYKIGSSVNPERRIIELRTTTPKLELQYSFGMTSQKTEATLHKKFSAQQIFNEFYELNDTDIEHIINHMTNHMSLHMYNHMVNGNVNGNESINRSAGEDENLPTKQKKTDPEITYPFESDEFTEKWAHWKEYKKKEFQFKYKSAQSEQAALSELANLSGGYEDKAIAIIIQSMAKGWKGFFELKTDSNVKGNSGKQSEADKHAEMQRNFAKADAMFGDRKHV